MKPFSILMVLVCLLSSCEKKDDNETIGTYIWAIDLETREETKLSDFESEPFYTNGLGYDWAKSGKAIFIGGGHNLEDNNEDIFKFDIESRKLQPIITSQWRDSRPVVSPDDTKIAFVSDRSGYFYDDIWVYDMANSQYRRLTDSSPKQQFYSNTSNLVWLDNDHLLVTLYREQNKRSEAYTIEVD